MHMADSDDIKQLIAKYPRLGVTLGWASAISLLAGYLATALGHFAKVKELLFQYVGPERLVSVHFGMQASAYALFIVGYIAAGVWIYRRFLASEVKQVRRWGWLSLLVVGFVTLTALSVYAAMPPAPDVKNILRDETTKWRKELLGLRNPDRGLRWSKVDRTVESQVWATAQVLVAVLSNKSTLNDQAAAQVRGHFDYIQTVLLPEGGEGWGYMEYVPWGVSEVNAWVALAYVKSLESTHRIAIWRDQQSEAEGRLAHCIKLLTSRQMPDGGWAPMNQSSNPRFARTYSTLMSTWALLEAKRLSKSDHYDEFIAGGVTWLLQHYSGEVGGWVPNPDRKHQLDSFPGLSSQVLFVLRRAQPDFGHLVTSDHYEAALATFSRWLRGEAIALRKDTVLSRAISSNDRTHDSDRYLPRSKYMVESSTFLWYPWILSACTALTERDGKTKDIDRYAGCGTLRARVNELVKFVRDDPFTYVTAESLLAVELYLSEG